jgi:lipid-A-disaccharide synthase-like uncharacterized protein
LVTWPLLQFAASTQPEPVMSNILQALLNFQITPWKVVGFLGMAMFTSRWFVQVYATRKHKRVVMPLSFWVLSVCGSVLLLAYFIVGKNDSVGILSNLFPVVVSVYNLVMHLRHQAPGTGESTTA